jgi:RNA polymerase sigma-70 factor (ECF subfamily)
MEGLSYQDVAQVMDTSVSAVESLLHRAKLNLRKTLENSLGERNDRNF